MSKSSKKITVTVLGSTGMLGAMVTHFLAQQKDLSVLATKRDGEKLPELVNVEYNSFDAIEFLRDQTGYEWLKDSQYIINCIGIIKPHCADHNPDQVLNAIRINGELPHVLARFVAGGETKILQIATDCVYSGAKGSYVESELHDALDVYGKTKSLGELEYPHTLNIRCSIIGPELKGKLSLMEWFLAQPKGSQLKGFAHHHWNGITTLQFAQLCHSIMVKNGFDELRKTHYTHHYTPNSTVNKYELLQIFQKVFGTDHPIERVDSGVPAVDRTISSMYEVLEMFGTSQSMEKAIQELHNYVQETNWREYA